MSDIDVRLVGWGRPARGFLARRPLVGLVAVGLLAVAACSGPADDGPTGTVEPSGPTSGTASGTEPGATVGDGVRDGVGDDAGGIDLAPGWPAVHHDPANSDTTPVAGVTDLVPGWRALDGWATVAIPSSFGDETVYFTSGGGPDGDPAGACHLLAVDAGDGSLRWCATEVGSLAGGSSALVDTRGFVYVPDETGVWSFDAAGAVRWHTPTGGLAISVQRAPDGRILAVTTVGRLHVLDPDDGSVLLATDLLGAGPDSDGAGTTAAPSAVVGCLGGGTESRCPSANTPAVSGDRIFLTLTPPGAGRTSVVALRYEGAAHPAVTTDWDVPALAGGSASSPTVSADGSRLYVNDRAGDLVALDTATGSVRWRTALGYTPSGSPSVSPEGVIVPTAGIGNRLQALVDEGDGARLLWRLDDVANRGLSVQVGGGLLYAVVVGPDTGDDGAVAVVETATGRILDLEPLPGLGGVSMGSAVGTDGRLWVAGLRSGLFELRPAPAP